MNSSKKKSPANWPDLNHHIPLKKDQAYGKKVLKTVKDNCDEDENIGRWIRDRLQEDVVQKYGAQWSSKEGDKSSLKFLGIGSGDGLIELAVIAELAETFPAISVTVVEPCPESVSTYQGHVQAAKERYKGVTWSWCTATLQEFSKENREKFDFISLIHTMYFSPLHELQSHLKTVYDVTATKGIILSVHDKETTYFPAVERLFPDVEHTLRPAIHCEYIKGALSRLDVRYRVIDDILAYVEVTKCFDRGSQEGRYILDSMLQVKEFVEHSKASEVEAFLDRLKSDIVALIKEDRYFINASAQVMVVLK